MRRAFGSMDRGWEDIDAVNIEGRTCDENRSLHYENSNVLKDRHASGAEGIEASNDCWIKRNSEVRSNAGNVFVSTFKR